MNKKVLLSSAAAAAIALTITGCGTDSISSSSLSGSGIKADLNGATVTLGSVTATTSSTGAFTLTVPATETGTAITITGGSYTLNGVDKNNTVTLKATKAQATAGAPVSMFTTLIQEFDGNTTAAANVLGIDYTDGVTNIANIDAGDFESAAISVATTMENADANLSGTLSTLQASATAKLTLAQLATNLQTAASTAGLSTAKQNLIAGITDSVANGEALGHALTMANQQDENVTYNASDYLLNNVINQEGNASATDTNASAFYNVAGGTPTTGIVRIGGAIDASSNMDNNNTAISFMIKDYSSTLTNANGNTSLFIKLSGLDAANANNSYIMGLTGLGVANSSDYLTLDENSTMELSTYSNSNVSYSTSVDSNATELFNTGFLSSASNANIVNVSQFKNFMDATYSDSDSNTSSIGHFTTGMNSGNYSLQVYVNVADQNISFNGRLSNTVGTTMTQTTNNGEKLFNGLKGYKVLDANLSY